MRRSLVFLTALVFLVGGAVAQSQVETEPEPGFVKAGAPLYGVDVFLDNVKMGVGLADPGEVAFERASEMAVANRRNDTQGFEEARNQLNRTVGKADENSVEGLEKASSVLEGLQSELPDEASKGLSTALENVEKARNRTSMGNRSRGNGGVIPDIETPDRGPG